MKMTRKKTRIAAFVAIIAILLMAAWFLFKPQGGMVVPTSDYSVLQPKEFSSRVAVNGAVTPVKTASLFTALQGPVTSLDVKVGDRVNEQQLIAHIDTSGLQRDLDRQLAEQASSGVGAGNTIEQAQTQYNQYKTALDQGLNPQINSAEAALRTADDQYNSAQIEFENRQSNVAAGRDPLIREQANAVNAARTQALAASINAVKAGIDVALAIGGDPTGQSVPGAVLGGADALNTVHGANRVLGEQEQTYLDNLVKIDQELATAQRGVASAFQGKREAATALEAARLGANQQLETYGESINQATRAAQAGQNVGELTNSQLRLDIASGDIRSPMNGVVTSVDAVQGKPVTGGSVLSVGDDSTLLIRAEIKEVDVPKVAVGQAVEFTTVATGAKKFRGKVTTISPVGVSEAPAAEGAAAAAAGTGGAKKVAFPIEIEVTGDRSGLLIGGTAKANIITQQKNNVLTVPRDAVYTDDSGAKTVLVIADGRITERHIEVGAANDIDTVITGGEIREGDKVINQPDSYRGQVGQLVTTND